jgi:tRNA pseudouridine38-40 synthase
VPTLKMTLAYDGTSYRGWQLQRGADTIQGRVESVLSRMAKAPIRVTAAGRTDSGVHAWGQTAHFVLEHPIPVEGILKGANAMLPGDIRVLAVERVEDAFHARFRARSKTYWYFLDRAKVPSPLRSRFTLHYPFPLDRDALDRAAAALVGEHDFAGFRASSCNARTTTRHCTHSAFRESGPELVYEVEANGFLHHMVRNLVGTLLQIGRGKRAPESIGDVLRSGDRTEAGPTAPPQGLHLVRVDYGS